MKVVVPAVAALAAAVTMWAGGVFCSRASSSPDSVAASCDVPDRAAACAVALRYLSALDLDRAEEVCALLDDSTLEAAGGMSGCKRTLSKARGIRIHFSIAAVHRSPLGTSIRFATWAEGDGPLRQQMLVSPRGRILAVVPEP